MPTYTAQDTETNKKITFEWYGSKPPDDNDMFEVFASARSQEPVHSVQEQKVDQLKEGITTVENIGKVYPAAETAANLATSTYGIPLSGLAGVFALPFGLEKSKDVIRDVQNALIYQPQTESGQQLTESATYPFQRLEDIGRYAGEKIEEAGYPNLAAATHSAIVGSPAIVGGRYALKRYQPMRLTSEINKAIDRGINKAVRPSVSGKETQGQIKLYRSKARTAVREIISNKDNLNLIDENGTKISGLPKTLDQFSQAMEQTKRNIFEDYDTLARVTKDSGIRINLSNIENNLKSVIDSKILKDLSPETIEYANDRINSLVEKIKEIQSESNIVDAYGRPFKKTEIKKTGRGYYTAIETQEAIQLLNQTLKKFYRDPSPDMKGKALVDSMIANNLRKSLDNAVNRATGKSYQTLKNKYGALRSIEKDVNHRAIVDANKNVKGLLDFSDIYTGYHVIRGVISRDPVTTSAGVIARVIKEYQKMKNNPNRIIKNMFEDTEKLIIKQ